MPYLVVWGAGEQELGRDTFPTLGAVRGMLLYDTDMTPEMIEAFILTGKSDSRDDDPTACTQFDYAWIRLEVVA
jgi:hypothetical protein